MSEQKPVQCIGIILDGNRRWARARSLPTLEGHRRGFENLKKMIKVVRDRGIPHLVVFAFSTENWNRSPDEVAYLMDIFRTLIKDSEKELGEAEGVRIRFLGQRERFDADIQEGMKDAEEKSAKNKRMTLWICLSYGARAEIVEAAKAAAQDGEITEETLRKHFWSAEMPDPDIIIRTSGEQRLSNFLLWQAAYSELFFVQPHWPDFNEAVLDQVLAEYAERERRHGK